VVVRVLAGIFVERRNLARAVRSSLLSMKEVVIIFVKNASMFVVIHQPLLRIMLRVQRILQLLQRIVLNLNLPPYYLIVLIVCLG
jgi:hypothetical protein